MQTQSPDQRASWYGALSTVHGVRSLASPLPPERADTLFGGHLERVSEVVARGWRSIVDGSFEGLKNSWCIGRRWRPARSDLVCFLLTGRKQAAHHHHPTTTTTQRDGGGLFLFLDSPPPSFQHLNGSVCAALRGFLMGVQTKCYQWTSAELFLFPHAVVPVFSCGSAARMMDALFDLKKIEASGRQHDRELTAPCPVFDKGAGTSWRLEDQLGRSCLACCEPLGGRARGARENEIDSLCDTAVTPQTPALTSC